MKSLITRRTFMAGAAGAAALPLSAPAVRAQSSRNLLFWHFYSQPERANYLRKMADLYQQANPGLTISLEAMPYPTVVNRIAAAKPANALPDLLLHGADTGIPLFASGDLLPMGDAVKQVGADAFVPNLLERTSLYQGEYLTLPHYVHTRTLIYRKDRLAEAGLTPPKTWDEALKTATALTKEPDYYGWTFQLNKGDIGGSTVLYPLTLTAGGGFFDAKGEVFFDSDPVRQATEFMVEVTRKAGGPGVFTYNINELFNLVNGGKTSLAQDAAAVVAVAEQKAPDVAAQLDAVPVPMRDKPGTLLQGGYFMVLKGQNKNPEDAAGFARFLLEPANHVEFLHTIPLFMFPTTKAAAGDAFFAHPVIKKHANVAKVSIDALENASLFGAQDGINPFASQVQNSHIIEEMLASIVLGNVAVNDAVKVAHDQMADVTKTLARRLGIK